VELTNVLTYENINTKKGGRKSFNKDFVFVSDLLDPSNSRLLI
jgi:hypothetical protein